jgi:hypothetical protein
MYNAYSSRLQLRMKRHPASSYAPELPIGGVYAERRPQIGGVAFCKTRIYLTVIPWLIRR